MKEQDILIQEGMNLLYSGMVVVFSFLVLLIISVNLLRIFFAVLIQNNTTEEGYDPLQTEQNDIHHKIIKEVLGGIRS
jgi:Na+-transporting methylmalonyl-CoA/oxaloacetate decarboxylase gamma subunit|tara:strand:+ start:949 stop:1182 length:234 start_codon:yes stop_codon:yes gene_type:complete